MRIWISVLIGVALAGVPAQSSACDDPSGVCVSDESAKWAADQGLSKKQRNKQHKKNRKRKKVAVSVEIQDGRGSAFIDGRYLGNGATQEIAPGKHDIQVRDGDQLLAQGVLTVPRNSAGITITVVHP
jgi:hypothetical protein